MEYPLRPPLFNLSLFITQDENSSGARGSGSASCEIDGIEWYNELRAMEAEVSGLTPAGSLVILIFRDRTCDQDSVFFFFPCISGEPSYLKDATLGLRKQYLGSPSILPSYAV